MDETTPKAGACAQVHPIKPAETLRRDLEAQHAAALRQRAESTGDEAKAASERIAKLEHMLAALAEREAARAIDVRAVEARVWMDVLDRLVEMSARRRSEARHGTPMAKAEAVATARIVGQVIRCARHCNTAKGEAA